MPFFIRYVYISIINDFYQRLILSLLLHGVRTNITRQKIISLEHILTSENSEVNFSFF